MEQILHATLRCVTPPNEAQLEKMKAFLAEHYHCDSVELEIKQDPSVRGGFVLNAGNDEYDWSMRSRQERLNDQIKKARDEAIQMDKSGSLMSILKEAVEQFEDSATKNEVGFVDTVGDGIATISGLEHAMYGEVVVFENGTKGMVQDITEDGIGVILFDQEGTIGQEPKFRTKRQAGMPVSDAF